MTDDNLRFKEIEHKYVVDERFDEQRFRDAVAALGPSRRLTIRVRDRYFDRARPRRHFLIRHRTTSSAP